MGETELGDDERFVLSGPDPHARMNQKAPARSATTASSIVIATRVAGSLGEMMPPAPVKLPGLR
jgi:hypothetical protein